MNRREIIKSLLAGTVAGGVLLHTSCDTITEKTKKLASLIDYGRTEEEKKRDLEVLSKTSLTPHELETLAHLADIILPANASFLSATQVGVVDFINYMTKDIKTHKTEIQGGIVWLDTYMLKNYEKDFVSSTHQQQIELCDAIAFPDKKNTDSQGIKFFNTVRNLVVTGYYTSQDGIKDLGYKGNSPNVWDGIPQEVLDKHQMVYEEKWLEKCIDQSTRSIKAEWDEQGNLLN